MLVGGKRLNVGEIAENYLTQLKQTTTPTIVYGASCQEIDILYQGNFPKVSPNDLIIFCCCGAYNQNMTPDFIFRKPETYFF